MKNDDSLGDRMKRYERVTHHHLAPNSWVFVRVDGRAFHTFLRGAGCNKPFDTHFMQAMRRATMWTARSMQGFKLAYVQSDEATFLVSDTNNNQAMPWFDNDLSKLISITASTFTMHFNIEFTAGLGRGTFDGRAFSIPEGDVPNMFVWRQKDWERNSLQMLAQSFFSNKQLKGKKRQDLHDMLMLEHDVNWADLTPMQKNGTFVTKDEFGLLRLASQQMSYADVADCLGIEVSQ